MYQALYRKYRPQSFSDVVGQQVIIKTLSNAVINNRISHAYLFSGPRGTGKTSIAKILAKLINCEELNGIEPCNKCVCCTQTNLKQNTDIIEIDAASNNGVEEIRELRNKVNLVPSYGKYKVYIIDEVHMLTTSAFNALLKTLEEPPQHIIFILATTEPHKIPETILSRCQRYDFKKISTTDIKERIEYVSKEENIKIKEDAVSLIANFSDGGLRDALGLLDQLSAYTQDEINVSDVHDVYGTILNTDINEILKEISNKNLVKIYDYIDEYDKKGKNLAKIISQLINYLKNLLIYLNCSDYFKTEEEKNIYGETLKYLKEEDIYKYIDILSESLKNIKTTNNVKLSFELAIIKIIESSTQNIKIEVKEEPKEVLKEKIKVEVKPIKIEPVEISEEEQEKINNLKDIRINNTLCNFNKKDLVEFKSKLDEITNLVIDPDYSSIASLILDGELKAKGDKNLLFVYDDEKISDYFNSSLTLIEKIFKKVFKENYLPISVSKNEWETIKKEFNNNLKNNIKKYTYIEEPKEIKKTTVKKNDKNQIEDMFDDVVYN